jgi:hypothetical protein
MRNFVNTTCATVIFLFGSGFFTKNYENIEYEKGDRRATADPGSFLLICEFYSLKNCNCHS